MYELFDCKVIMLSQLYYVQFFFNWPVLNFLSVEITLPDTFFDHGGCQSGTKVFLNRLLTGKFRGCQLKNHPVLISRYFYYRLRAPLSLDSANVHASGQE